MTIQAGAVYRALHIGRRLLHKLALGGLLGIVIAGPPACAETLPDALAKASRNIHELLHASSAPPNTKARWRETEANVLQIAVQCYMDLLRDAAIYNLDSDNVDVIDELRQAAQERFAAGQAATGDVTAVEARLSLAHSLEDGARTTLKASIANYRQIVGEKPDILEPASLPDNALPDTLEAALAAHAAEPGPLPGGVTAAWNAFGAAKATVTAAEGRVVAATSARDNAREDLGPLERLDIQQSLLNARIALIVAQHHRVVAAYALLAAMGRLSAESLGLPTVAMDPHLEAAK